jgi:hypothetical protein
VEWIHVCTQHGSIAHCRRHIGLSGDRTWAAADIVRERDITLVWVDGASTYHDGDRNGQGAHAGNEHIA